MPRNELALVSRRVLAGDENQLLQKQRSWVDWVHDARPGLIRFGFEVYDIHHRSIHHRCRRQKGSMLWIHVCLSSFRSGRVDGVNLPSYHVALTVGSYWSGWSPISLDRESSSSRRMFCNDGAWWEKLIVRIGIGLRCTIYGDFYVFDSDSVDTWL